MSKLRIVFMGTPDFAVPALNALAVAGHEIAAAYCQPPKPAGRGQDIQKTPVHLAAEGMEITVRCPLSLRKQEAVDELAAFVPDLIVVAAYGLILPQSVLDIPRLGCMNIHGSLLPRWRGAAPLQRAILAGDQETGITIMQMDAGLDTGAMLLKRCMPLTPQTTASSLHDAMAALGAEMIVEALELAMSGQLKPQKQPEEGVTYAAKLSREDGVISWKNDAAFIDRQVRALNPWPSVFFMLENEKIKVLQAEAVNGLSGRPGELLDDEMTIACGTGALRLLSVQRAGKKPTDGASFLRGLRLKKGHVFA